MQTLVLVDVMNLSFRSHFAFKGLQHKGHPTSVFYGFLNAVYSLQEKFGERLVFCWDGIPGQPYRTSWRKEFYPGYKAKRKPSDDREDVHKQLLRLYGILQTLGYPNLGIPGMEADDMIGLVSALTKNRCYIFSTDRDMYQLLEGDRVIVVQPKKQDGKYVLITQAQVEKEYGIGIIHWPKYLALGGDQSDDIHVVQGLGPKTGIKMIQAGAHPGIAFEAQPKEVQKAYVKYEPYWTELSKAWEVARIPRKLSDFRICTHVHGVTINPRTLVRQVADYNKSLNTFTKFCAEFGLSEFLAIRREFMRRVSNGKT
jgi:5'-3' exonuclease